MSRTTQIRAGAIFSMLVFGLFAAISGQAVYSLFGFPLTIVVAVATAWILWAVWTESEQRIEYLDALMWDGVDIVSKDLLGRRPRNVTDAHELIQVLENRILDLDDARNEAVERYNELKSQTQDDDDASV